MRGARRVGRLAGAAWVAGGAWAACVALTVAARLLASANDSASVWTSSLASLVLVVYASVGTLIASRRPGNLIGWLFCSGAMVTAAGLLAQQSGHYALITRPGSLPGGVFLAWAGRWLTSLGFGLIINFLLLLFPDGRLPSPGWRPLGWLAAVTIGLTTVVYMLLPGSRARGRTDFGEFAGVQNPFGLASAAGVLDALANVGVPMVSCAVTLAEHARPHEAQVEHATVRPRTWSGNATHAPSPSSSESGRWA
jgi:hypothetical protein